MDVASLLFGHSKALYSSWVFYKPDHLLIDCGEGAATALGNGSYGIEKVLLTHGHIDHISGLPSLLWSRAAGMGDNEKPLEIFYPRDDIFVADLQAYLERTTARLPFDLTWTPIDTTTEIALGHSQSTLNGETSSRHKRRVQTFATRHIRDRLTLGYKIVETRRRLKSEWAHLTQQELRVKAQSKGPQAMRELSEDYDAPLAAFSGDTLPIDVDQV
ncbi:MAG: ribonuclease, partial [Abditibacteriota bacterium]|nr:ribonuclease [Abditibacteriota bacterium]